MAPALLWGATWTFPRPVTLVIRSKPSGASVYLDGSFVGQTPVRVADVKPGPHVARLRGPGVDRTRKPIVIPWSLGRGVSAWLDPPELVCDFAATSRATGKLVIRSEPEGAEVFLDGKWRGVTPVRLDSVTAGRCEVRLVRPGYDPETLAADVRPNETTVAKGRLRSRTVDLLKERIRKTSGALHDRVDLAHQYLVMGEHKKVVAELRAAYAIIKAGKIVVGEGEDGRPEYRFYAELWKTYVRAHKYPEEGSKTVRKTCMELMEKAYDDFPDDKTIRRLYTRMKKRQEAQE